MIGLGGFKAWALKWLAIAGAAIIALATTALVFLRKGQKLQAGIDAAGAAKAETETALAVQKAAQDRAEVDNETAKLPDAPAQSVANADPGTAAGKLRDDGWVRGDQANHADPDHR